MLRSSDAGRVTGKTIRWDPTAMAGMVSMDSGGSHGNRGLTACLSLDLMYPTASKMSLH